MQEKSKGHVCRLICTSEGDRAAGVRMLIATTLDAHPASTDSAVECVRVGGVQEEVAMFKV
jgi:hypothetical protein